MRTLSIIALNFFTLTCIAQKSPIWDWAKIAGKGIGTINYWENTIAVDNAENIYVAGGFEGTLVMGSTTLNSAGGKDAYFAKYDANGNLLWAKSIGGGGDDEATGIAVAPDGSIALCGYYFGGIAIGTDYLTSAGVEDVFLFKCDSEGNPLWAKSGGGSHPDKALSVSVDAVGNIGITGLFGSNQSNTAKFGNILLASSGSIEMFIAKYNMNGQIVWAKSAGGASADLANNIVFDIIGNSYISGQFGYPSAMFGTNKVSTNEIAAMFIAKYDADGNAVWAKGADGAEISTAKSAVIDKNGNVFITGYFFKKDMTLASISLPNMGTFDVFLVKYDAGGNPLWAKNGGWMGIDVGSSLALDESGNVYMAGYYSDKGIFNNDTLSSYGGEDIFVTKYNPGNGDVVWAQRAGGKGADAGFGIAAGNSGNIYVTGRTASTSVAFGNHTINKGSTNDMFIAKLGMFPQSVRNTEQAAKSAIYPNPVGNVLYLHTQLLAAGATYIIIDIAGRTKQSGIASQAVDVQHLVPGIYIIHIITPAETTRYKFIKN